MSGSFLDTTIVIGVSDAEKPNDDQKSYLASHPPCEAPYYALRELLAGFLQYHATAYNFLKGANNNPALALSAILKMNFNRPRAKNSTLEIFSQAFTDASHPNSNPAQISREMMLNLALQIQGIWLEARQSSHYKTIQPLSCLEDGEFSFGDSGEIVPPNNSFNCSKKMRCAAAGYMHSHLPEVSKMIDALNPKNLPSKLAAKAEIASRRKALKELRDKGPREFSKRSCRALGDAYFVAMCPAGSAVITTNTDDFVPLCGSLSRNLHKP